MLIYPKEPINLNTINWKRKKRIKPHTHSYLDNLFFINTKNKNKIEKKLENIKQIEEEKNNFNDDKDPLNNSFLSLPEEQKFFVKEDEELNEKTKNILKVIEESPHDIHINWRKIPEKYTDFSYLTYSLYKKLDKKYLTLLHSDEIIMLGYIVFCVRLHGLSKEPPYEVKILRLKWKNDGFWNCASPSQSYFAEKYKVSLYNTKISFSDMEQMGLFSSRQLPVGLSAKKKYELVRRPKCYWLQYPIFKALIRTYYNEFPEAFIINKIENMEEYYARLESMKEKKKELKKEQEKTGINFKLMAQKYEILFTGYGDDKPRIINSVKSFKKRLPYLEQKLFIEQFKKDIDLTKEKEKVEKTKLVFLQIDKNPTETPQQIKDKLYILDEYKRGKIKGLSVFPSKKNPIKKSYTKTKSIRKNPDGFYFTIDNIAPFILKNKKLPFDCSSKITEELKIKYQEWLLAVLHSATINIFDARNYPRIRQAMQYFYACYENFIPPKDEFLLKKWKNRESHVLYTVVEYCFGDWIPLFFHLQKLTNLEKIALKNGIVINSNTYDPISKVILYLGLAKLLIQARADRENIKNSASLDIYTHFLLENWQKEIRKILKQNTRTLIYNNNVYNTKIELCEYRYMYKLINVYMSNNNNCKYYNNYLLNNIQLLENNIIVCSSSPLSTERESSKKVEKSFLTIPRHNSNFPYFETEDLYAMHDIYYEKFISKQRERIFHPVRLKTDKEKIGAPRIDSKKTYKQLASQKKVNRGKIADRVDKVAPFPLYREEMFSTMFSMLALWTLVGTGTGKEKLQEYPCESLSIPESIHLSKKLFRENSPKKDTFSVENFSGFSICNNFSEELGKTCFLSFSDMIHQYFIKKYNIFESGIYSQFAWHDSEFSCFLNKIKDFPKIKYSFIYPKIGVMKNYYDLQRIYFEYIKEKKEKIIHRYEDQYHEAKIKIYLRLQHLLRNAEFTPKYMFQDLFSYFKNIITPERIVLEKNNNTFEKFLLKLEFSGIFHVYPDNLDMFPYQELFNYYMFQINV